jgi:hypothetical protein
MIPIKIRRIMFLWTPLFIIAYKLSWVDWSLWWLCLTLFFDGGVRKYLKMEIKDGKKLCLNPCTSKNV